ncbi:MAG: phosphoenolpyruvate--protein phosphotransferase [Phycisphaeraceae bacterium]|nr:phosphoenolpyruvate--protein phosphotransferase [Phycisphaeraceae bacterium]
MDRLEGIPVSRGVVIGRVFVLDDSTTRIRRRTISAERIEAEIERFEQARAAAMDGLNRLYAEAQRDIGVEAAKIFLFHLGMLQDKTLIEPVRAQIREQRVSAEFAVSEVFRAWAEQLAGMTDSVFATKADDVRDLTNRLLAELVGERQEEIERAGRDAVVIARDMTPTQAVRFGRAGVLGFATDLGGRTSHTAIVAKALHLPAVVGARGSTRIAQTGQTAIVDGDDGVLILDPDEPTLSRYRRRMESARTYQVSLGELSALDASTTDGVAISLMGNIEFPGEVDDVHEMGGHGVGLYRTEFLYLTGEAEPTEEDHFEAYRRCIERLAGEPLTIRTLDLGADKYTQAREEIPERNPFLGCRSIRYCLRSLPMFKTQLRAILRASALGPVKMMFPLVTSVAEFRQARLHVNDVMEDLADQSIAFDAKVPVGMMVEVPSAAILAESFAREADFFSIGTNDLVQYTLAVDRTNERVAHLYEPTHPAVLRLVRQVIKAARRQKIDVSCCGEAAADVEYALLLIGLGLRTLSVTAGSIPALKRAVRSVDVKTCERMAAKAITLDSAAQVSAFLRTRARTIVPEAFDGRSVE